MLITLKEDLFGLCSGGEEGCMYYYLGKWWSLMGRGCEGELGGGRSGRK